MWCYRTVPVFKIKVQIKLFTDYDILKQATLTRCMNGHLVLDDHALFRFYKKNA